MCRWLFSEARATAIVATDVDVDNVPSRRVLDKLGFAEIDQNERHVSWLYERRRDGTR